MKIDINKIPPEGLTLEEAVLPAGMDLETEIVRFAGPLQARAEVLRITNAITVDLVLVACLRMNCSRCLEEFEHGLKKQLRLNYIGDSAQPVIDLDPEIREEIILDYPMKPLCRPDCAGLCPKCGKNLNTGECACS